MKTISETEVKDHVHCPECGQVLKEIHRLYWTTKHGVRFIYSCNDHLYFNSEDNKKLKRLLS